MKPILFNTEMIRAILDSRKTQTRRINKDGSEFSVPDMSFFDPVSRTYAIRNYADYEHQQRTSLVQAPVPICPGDVLYVRETWTRASTWFGVDPSVGINDGYLYRADWDVEDHPIWNPSIHMPKDAARIFLRVTDVRVERLQDITNADAIREGASEKTAMDVAGSMIELEPWQDFMQIWENTIKPADRDRYGWAANPLVWVICFERYDPADPEKEETT